MSATELRYAAQLIQSGRAADAVPIAQSVAAKTPDSLEANIVLAIALTFLGRIREAHEPLQRAFTIDPSPARASALLFNYMYLDEATPQRIFDDHVRIAAAYPKPNPPTLRPPANRKIRIGWLSPDFRAHSVSFFISPLLTRPDRNRFDVYCYADVVNPDIVTQRLRAKPNTWRDVAQLSDDQLDALIREDKIDILIDLAGHTARNRSSVVARKPAPIVVNYLGYPETTGLPAIDYRLTDAHSDPPGIERFNTEKIVRLPNCFICFVIPRNLPPPTPPPCLSRPDITFGCFNNILKLSPTIIALWSRLLHAVPNSRIVLKSSFRADPGARDVVIERFAVNSIDRSRIEFLDRRDILIDHLVCYPGIDIALDTLPYHGVTTTCEALEMGVPVVSLPGERPVSRAAVSIFNNANLTELLARDADDFVKIAVELANDRQRIARYRQTLRTQMSQSPLCDSPRFVREVEQAFEWMLNQPRG